MQKTLTSVEACGPSARQAVAGSPVAVIVVAAPFPKAPSVRCSQRTNGEEVHWELKVQGCGGFWNGNGATLLRQNPQKTFDWVGLVGAFGAAVSLAEPVVRANGIGSVPMKPDSGGGQSWLLG